METTPSDAFNIATCKLRIKEQINKYKKERNAILDKIIDHWKGHKKPGFDMMRQTLVPGTKLVDVEATTAIYWTMEMCHGCKCEIKKEAIRWFPQFVRIAGKLEAYQEVLHTVFGEVVKEEENIKRLSEKDIRRLFI